MSSEHEKTYIGAGRADEIAVSSVLPFVAAVRPEEPSARTLYERYPSPPANRWTRYMTSLIVDAGHEYKAKRAPEHQGLHYLYHRFCRRQRGDECPVCDG
jgi:hypothetical protein